MVKLIVAKGANDVIGKDNDLIWHLPADMRFFKETTIGHIVIMGRKNWESIPQKFRPLPQRINAVISRNNFLDNGCTTFESIENAIDFYKKTELTKDIFIIGGGQIYRHTIENNLVDEMLVTQVEKDFEGDTWFPKIDENKWEKELVLEHQKDEKNLFDFSVWRYSPRPHPWPLSTGEGLEVR